MESGCRGAAVYVVFVRSDPPLSEAVAVCRASGPAAAEEEAVAPGLRRLRSANDDQDLHGCSGTG